MLSGCGFFQRSLNDMFPGKSSEMFFPQMVLPTETCAFCFTFGSNPALTKEFCFLQTAGVTASFESLKQLKALPPLSFKTVATFQLKAQTGPHEGKERCL